MNILDLYWRQCSPLQIKSDFNIQPNLFRGKRTMPHYFNRIQKVLQYRNLILPVLIIFVILLLQSCFKGPADFRTLTILETSDLHGFIYNWDFFSGAEYDQGLSIVNTIVKEERAKDPDLLLLDGGDTIQGTPLIYYFNMIKPGPVNPMALVMNAMKYDAMTVGNHEYNYGQEVLNKFRRESEFPLLSANIIKENGSPEFIPYIIREIKGVKVGILGLTTVGIPIWEKPEHIMGLNFRDAVETAKQYVPLLKKKGATVVIVLAHSGTHLEPENSRDGLSWMASHSNWVDKGYAEYADQNFVIKLAEAVPEIDAILTGHAHSTIPQAFVNGVLIVEPSHWGRGISKINLTVDHKGRVVSKSGEFISSKDREPDPEILELAKPYHDEALEYVNSVIGVAEGEFPGAYQARYQDGPLADFINSGQLAMAEEAGFPAQISSAAIFNNRGWIDQGEITVSEIYSIYQFDNTLVVLEVTGDILRRALEHDARYWNQIDPHDFDYSPENLISSNVRNYNWDMFTGINYVVDITRPIGERITSLTYNGREVLPDQTFIMALNSYRAGGGGGYTMYTEARIVWKSMSEIRDYLLEYVENQKNLNPEKYFVKNWALYPEIDG